jgi:poly-gamma-glutamate synthesis protein (capsule biosynthesis protein)
MFEKKTLKIPGILYLFYAFLACAANEQNTSQVRDTLQETADSIIKIQVSAVGDLMCHNTQSLLAKVSSDSFNYKPCFEYVRPYLLKPDLLLGNLETTFAGKTLPYSGYPKFNTPDDYAEALQYAGFDFLVTANNHSNDTGEKGILRTIEVLDHYAIHHTGTYTSQNDRDSIRLQNVNGITIAILAYTYSTNGYALTAGKPWLANYCDSSLIQNDIKSAKKSGANLVLVFYHFGDEYQRTPSAYQKNFVNWAIDNGADIILGSHPHVLQPAAYFKTKNGTLDSGFVAYSMGNFISNQRDNYTDEGIIINMYIEKNKRTGKTVITSVDYVPTWVYKGTNPAKKLHVVLPVLQYEKFDTLPFIGEVELKEMKLARQHTRDIMQKMASNIGVIGE